MQSFRERGVFVLRIRQLYQQTECTIAAYFKAVLRKSSSVVSAVNTLHSSTNSSRSSSGSLISR
jgi:hypothetical protein